MCTALGMSKYTFYRRYKLKLAHQYEVKQTNNVSLAEEHRKWTIAFMHTENVIALQFNT